MIGKQWCVTDTLTGAVYPQPNKMIAEKVAEMHGQSEVFEHAHTPSDDEREALIRRLEDEISYRVRTAVALHKGGHDYEEQVRQGRSSVRFLAAGFRRTVQGEPKHDESCIEWCNHCSVCGEGIQYGSRCRDHYLNQEAVQGEPMRTYFDGLNQGQSPSEALKKALAERCACGHVEHDYNGGECYESGCKCRAWKVQGEPTDAAVRAVWDALGPGITVAFEYEELRAALRASAAVREGQ